MSDLTKTVSIVAPFFNEGENVDHFQRGLEPLLEPEAHCNMAVTGARHWWFAGRRANLATIISKTKLQKDARILEIGIGGHLEMPAGFGSERFLLGRMALPFGVALLAVLRVA